MATESETGLDSTNRGILSAMVLGALALVDPTDPSGTIPHFVIILTPPFVVWFALRFWATRWPIDATENIQINRLLWGVLTGSLLVIAYVMYNRGYRFDCTQMIRTRDGQECVGDYVRVQGADVESAMMCLIFAGLSFYIGYARRRE